MAVPTRTAGHTTSGAMVVPATDRPIGLSLVLPTFNERNNLPAMVAQVCDVLDRVRPDDYELIVVDDDSPDRTWEVAEALQVDYPALRVLRRVDERGLSSAVVAGWQMSHGRVIGVIDADLQHPPETLAALLHGIDGGADLVVASRHVEGGGVSDWSVLRRILSRGAQTVGVVMLPEVVGRVTDPMSGFFLVRRDAVVGAPLRPLGYKILIEVLARGSVGRVDEVGYVFNERTEGASKVTKKQYVEYLRHLWRLRRDSPWGWLALRHSVPVVRLMRFGIVGLSGVVVDMTVLYALSDPSALGMGLTRSKILAAEIAILNNFIWNDRWTFRDLVKDDTSQAGWMRRLVKFNLICLAGLVLNVLLLNLLFNVVGMNRYVANLIAIAAVTAWNFGVNLALNWRTTAAASTDVAAS